MGGHAPGRKGRGQCLERMLGWLWESGGMVVGQNQEEFC